MTSFSDDFSSVLDLDDVSVVTGGSQMSRTTYFVTKPCPCLKQRRPNLSTHAPLTSVTTSPPFELVSVDFLHDLDQSPGGYEYIRLYIDL